MKDPGQFTITDVIRQNRWIILSLFLVGFALRLIWLFYARTVPVSDFLEYFALGQNIREHLAFGLPEPNYWRLPVYPAFLALLMLVSRNLIWLGFWNVLLSSLCIVQIYLIAFRLSEGNRLIAGIAGAVGLFNLTLLFLPPVLASEFLFSFFVLTALIGSLYRVNRPIIRFPLIGVLMGLSVLTRGEGLFYIPVFLILIFMWREDSLRHALTWGLVFVICCVAVITPWYLRNRYVAGPGTGLSPLAGSISTTVTTTPFTAGARTREPCSRDWIERRPAGSATRSASSISRGPCPGAYQQRRERNEGPFRLVGLPDPFEQTVDAAVFR